MTVIKLLVVQENYMQSMIPNNNRKLTKIYNPITIMIMIKINLINQICFLKRLKTKLSTAQIKM